MDTAPLARTANRLDELHSQITALNDALQEMLNEEASLPRERAHKRMRPSAPERQRFKRQALMLAIYAPY